MFGPHNDILGALDMTFILDLYVLIRACVFMYRLKMDRPNTHVNLFVVKSSFISLSRASSVCSGTCHLIGIILATLSTDIEWEENGLKKIKYKCK